MSVVNAGVNGFYGSVDRVAFLITSDDIVAHLKRYYLLVVENILDNDNGTQVVVLDKVFWVFFLLSVAEFAFTYPYTKLLVALRTYKY